MNASEPVSPLQIEVDQLPLSDPESSSGGSMKGDSAAIHRPPSEIRIQPEMRSDMRGVDGRPSSS
jgi:hypothetical protein